MRFLNKGIALGYEKPDFNVFLAPLLKELKRLEYGISIDGKNVRFFVISGVYDKPARASLLNIMSSNGHYGCIRCLQPGKTLQVSEKGNLNLFSKFINIFLIFAFLNVRSRTHLSVY